jgi:hypothetical protein
MLVRGAGENFNLMVPVRRMKVWAEQNSILWALDKSVKTPKMEEIEELPIEGKKELEKKSKKGKSSSFTTEYPFLIKVTTNQL